MNRRYAIALCAALLAGCGKLGPMSTVFVVSKPPYQDGARWKMVMDGMELTRATGD